MTTLVLDATNKTIVAVMSGAAATTNPSYVVSYADNNGTTFTEGSQSGSLSGTTPTTIVSAPASGYRRVIKKIYIENADTAVTTVTVYYNNNGTNSNIAKVALAVSDTWTTDGTFTSTGALKQSTGATTTGTSSQLLANDGAGGFTNVTVAGSLTYSAGTLTGTGVTTGKSIAMAMIFGG